MKNNHSLKWLDYYLFSNKLEKISSQKKILINTINQYSYCIAEKDSEFKRALIESDVLLPDGIGIVLAMKFLYRKKIKKIAGADLHHYFLEKLNKNSGSCFYMGSSRETLAKIKKRIQLEYPKIKFGSYSPPYKPKFSRAENMVILDEINTFSPDVLFVGLTAPKQEKWSYTNKEMLDVKTICSIGAVFDFYAGTIERPNTIWINLGLEWLGRLLKEPKRMWKRYIYYGVVFLIYLIREKSRLILKSSS